MAEASRRRGIFGRLLTAFGFVWIFWALFGELVTVELGTASLSLPLLPGFVFLFLGRALSRGARRRPIESETVEPSRPSTRTPAPRPVEPRPVAGQRQLEELKPAETPDPVILEEVIAEAMESDIDLGSPVTGARKTSAEMVAEARERFGRKTG